VYSPQLRKLANRQEEEQRKCLETARNEITARLRRVSSDLSEDEFQALVEKVLRNRVRNPQF
jgi:hypothetical protein